MGTVFKTFGVLNLQLIVELCQHNYSGPKGARVKVSPPLFVFIFRVLNFLLGYKA